MKRFLPSLALAFVVLAACGGNGGRSLVGPPPPPKIVPGSLDASILLADVAQRAGKNGASQLSMVVGGPMTENEQHGAFVEIAPDTCLLAYARAAGSVEDIDVVALSDEGNALAVDERPDPRPTIILCPPHPPRVFLAVRVVSGEGVVALGAHAVPRDRGAEMARALGARGAVVDAAARRAEAWPGLDDRVRNHRSSLGGKWEDVRKVAVAVDARSPSVVGLPVDADQCVDVVVVPDDDVALLDVEARDGEGRVVARAKESGRDRTMELCSSLAISGTLSIRPHLGSGLVAVVVGRAKSDVVKELTTGVETAWTGATTTVDQAKAARALLLAKVGYGAPVWSGTGNAAMGKRTAIAADAVTPCSRIDVVGGTPLALVDVRAWDDAAALVGSTEGSNGAVLFSCGKKKLHLEIEARGRPGPFAIEIRKEPWEHASFTTAPLAASRMLSRFVDGPPWTAIGTAGSVRLEALDPAKRATWEESIAAGACANVAAGAEGEGTGLELRAIEVGTDDEIDRSHGDNAVKVQVCATQAAARKIRYELSSTGGKLTAVIGARTSK